VGLILERRQQQQLQRVFPKHKTSPKKSLFPEFSNLERISCLGAFFNGFISFLTVVPGAFIFGEAFHWRETVDNTNPFYVLVLTSAFIGMYHFLGLFVAVLKSTAPQNRFSFVQRQTPLFLISLVNLSTPMAHTQLLKLQKSLYTTV